MADEPPLQPLVVPASSIPDPTRPPPPAPDAIPSPVASPVRTETPAVLTGGPTALNAPATGKYAENSPLLPMINQSLRDLGIKIDPYVDPSSSLIMNQRPDALAELIARTGKPGPLPIDQVPNIFRPIDLPGGGGQLKPSLGRLGNVFLDYLYHETPMGAVAQGIEALMGEPLLPSLARVGQIREGMNYDYVPGYDIFKDRKITDAGLDSQMHLFYGSMSPDRTEQIIQRVQDKARQADYVERTGSGAAIAEFAAGILGDPLTFLPATLLLKGPALAAKALRGGLTGAEMNLVSIPRSVFGTMGDGLTYAGLSAVLPVVQRSIENGYDPTKSIEEVIDSLYMPMAISASMAMVISGFSRRTARSLVQRARDPDFLKGTPASGARYVPDDLMGPVIHPSDEAAAGLVSRYDDAATQARRMERTMPGDRFGGPRDKMPFNGTADANGNLPPGAFATNYADVRKAEFAAKPENAPYLRERPDFQAFMAGSMVTDAAGKPQLMYHGTTQAFRRFDFGRAGATTGEDIAHGGQWFTLDPHTASAYADAPGGNVHPVYLRATNPKNITAEIVPNLTNDMAGMDKTLQSIKQAIGKAKAEGHDAVVMNASDGSPGSAPTVQMVVFDKKQIRGFDQRYDVREPKAAAAGPAAEPIPVIVNTIDERGRDRVHDRSGTYLNAKDLPEGQRLVDPLGNTLVVRNGTFYPEKVHQTPMASAETGGRGWLPTREEQAAAEEAAVKPKQRLVDMEFKPGELERVSEAERTKSKDLEGHAGLVRTPPKDLAAGTHEPGIQQAYVIMRDGSIWEITRDFRMTDDERNRIMENTPDYDYHAMFFNRFPDMSGQVVRMTRYENSIAADIPEAGRSAQQEATLRRLKRSWENEGLGDMAMLHPKVETPLEQVAAQGPTTERTGVGLPPQETTEAGSVGAALSPQSLVYQREVLLAQGRMAPTGIGMERWPLSPVHRIFLGESVEAMRAAGDLVSTGGGITVGNKQGIGGLPPVETLIQSNWEHMTLTAVRGMKDDWAEARHANAAASMQTQPTSVDFSGRSDIRRLGAELGDAIKRKFVRGEPGLSYNDYLARVTDGLRNGDVDIVADGNSPYIERSIARHREVYETTKARMLEAGVFDEAYEAAKFDAYAEVRAVKKEADEIKARANIERWPPARERAAEEALLARMEDAEFHAKQAESQLDKLRQHGPQLNGTAPSYAPRLWDAGTLKAKEEHFVADVAVPWLMSPTGGGIADAMEATRIAKEMHTILSKQNPVFERADVKNLFHSVAAPGSAMARTFAIPDELVKEFLIDDAELLLRYHVKQNAVAVEMKRRFGSMDMAEQIAAVEQEYRGQIIAANAGSDVPTEEAIRLTKLMKSDISDLQALRDKLYGTYGAAADPHAWDSRLIRMAKQFANITLLGGSGVSSLGDFVRPLMTEGLDAMYGYGLRSLMGDMRGTILKLGKEDMQLAGVGSDLMNNVRALQAADTGDVFGSRGRLEHGLNTANQWMFVANGLNQITEWSKNWANVIIQGKMNKAIGTWLETGQIDDFMRTRLASLGITEPEARRIGLQLKIHGQQFDDLRLANIGKWEDDYAAEIYKAALNQSVNRTVVTPGVGDRPNILSTELGSLIGQYKSWAIANMTRSLQSGLQEGGSQFWYGAAAAVGFAIIVNELKSRLMYDRSTFDRPATAVIADGIDRSSILGWFSDANRAVETLTGNRLGVKALTGAPATAIDPARAVGTVAGPAAGQAFRAGSVMNDFIAGHPTAKTFSNLRTVLPGQNLPYLDPVYDHLISDGNFRRGMQRSADKQGRPAP